MLGLTPHPHPHQSTMSDLAESDIAHAFATIVFNIQVTRYTLVAGAAVWAYDVLLTFADEVSLLWSRGGILVKLLYLIVRIETLSALFGTSANGYIESLPSTCLTLHHSHPSVYTVCYNPQSDFTRRSQCSRKRSDTC